MPVSHARPPRTHSGNGGQPVATPPVAQPTPATLDGNDTAGLGSKKKSKKKKKSKGKSSDLTNSNPTNGGINVDVEVEEEMYAYSAAEMSAVVDDLERNGWLPELSRSHGKLKAGTRQATTTTTTGLSPDLESVHFSTTQALASMASAGRGGFNTSTYASMSPINQAEMLAELYRNVDFTNTTTRGTFNVAAAKATAKELREASAEVRESMNSLSGTMRQFVQTALAQMADLGLSDSDLKQRSIQSIAKEMLDNGIGVGVGFGMSIGAKGRVPAGKDGGTDAGGGVEMGQLPEMALAQALERLASGKSPLANSRGMHADVVLSHEFLEDEGAYEDDEEVFSESDVGEGETVDMRLHMTMSSKVPTVRSTDSASRGLNGAAAAGGESAAEEMPGAFPKEAGRESRVSQKSKKNQKVKKVVTEIAGHVTRGREGQTVTQQHSQPTALVDSDNDDSDDDPPANMPAQPKPVPPSSRAMGKQPMAYPPPTSTTTTTQSNPPRSARAQAKAPAAPYASHTHSHHHSSPPASNASAPQKLRPPAGGTQNAQQPKPNSKIWSTNTTEERERIKEFWLGLSEENRRALVKIEKDAVLRRMKEQQKHSCTCAVCGRKRNAIEEELEVLYDAYYDELEQYANYQQRYANSGGTIPPPPGPGPFPGSVELDKNGVVVGPGGRTTAAHPNGRHQKVANGPKKQQHPVPPESEFDEEDADEGEYEEDEYEDEEDEEDEEEEDVDVEDDVDIRNRTGHRTAPTRERSRTVADGKANGREDLFSLGTSLTVTGPGNILTVADDLLKNDGKKFLEMMEQLAERRMQRELDAVGDVEDSEEDEDEEADEDEEGDEDDEDEDDEELMTDEQKMEEGKRMFSIFAARMFESRVLEAYREKVAQERQKELLRELEEEESLTKRKEAKKANANQKKKDKKKQQKQLKEEEKAAKIAEKAAEEAAAKEKQERQEREQKLRREAEKAKREAARKAAEEERQRKEEERRKRMLEEKEAQAEKERRRKEKEEKARIERKEREERERKVREEKEARLAAEKAKREQMEKEEREKREKQLAEERERERERKEREREIKEKEAKERAVKEAQAKAAAAATAKARPSSPHRTNSTASGSQRPAQQVITPKKILTKASTQGSPTATSGAPNARQPPRPIVPVQTTSSAPQVQSPIPRTSTVTGSPTVPSSVPPSASTFAPVNPGAPMQQPTMSPRTAPFPSASGLSPFGAYLPQMPQTLGPSPMPRTFGSGPPFDTGFPRGLGPAAPIVPPKMGGITASMTSPVIAPGSAAAAIQPPRRMSSAADGLGPIGRPIGSIGSIAPIARPAANGDSIAASNAIGGGGQSSKSNSGNASPVRRSPSPKGVLGSSALAADDDEVVSTAPSRRHMAPAPVGVPGGGSWHSPRNSIAVPPSPWGATPPSQGFSPSRGGLGGSAIGGGIGSLGMSGGGLWGQPSFPPGHGSVASNNPLAGLSGAGGPMNGTGGGMGDWGHPAHPGSQFFGGPPFMHPNHSTVTPPPHASGN